MFKFRGVEINPSLECKIIRGYGIINKPEENTIIHDEDSNRWVTVMSGTVGQYIGINDIYDKEIYVHDLVKVRTCYICDGNTMYETYLGEVIYDKDNARFAIKIIKHLERPNFKMPIRENTITNISDWDEIVVVGNTFEKSDYINDDNINNKDYEIIYGNKPNLLFDESVNEYRIIGKTLGSYPTAYVGVPEEHPLYGLDYEVFNGFIGIHGGFTFSKKGDDLLLPEGYWWYGWDYAHWSDYINVINPYGKKWTINEIKDDALDVIYQFENIKGLAKALIDKIIKEIIEKV